MHVHILGYRCSFVGSYHQLSHDIVQTAGPGRIKHQGDILQIECRPTSLMSPTKLNNRFPLFVSEMTLSYDLDWDQR